MLWQGCVHRSGYGQFKLHGRQLAAHRMAYELRIGRIPEGLVIDHLCRVRHCVAPLHLEAVTNAENIRRGETGLRSGAYMRAKTHCPRGHAYDAANTYIRSDGSRICRTCKSRRSRNYYERKTGRRASGAMPEGGT
jgi:hypothetical protein